MAYRHLQKGEIIQAGDQVDRCSDPWRDAAVWEPAGNIGEAAPDPQYPSHRQYRRPIPDMKATRVGEIVMFHCPGCECCHGPRVEGEHKWGWNGSLESPTFTPSILVRGVKPITDDEHKRIMAGEKIEPVPTCCHSFVTDGKIKFLSDCTHALAGQTVEIPDWETI